MDRLVQPVQKKMLDEFMEKYNLQNQDWRKQMMKKKRGSHPLFAV